MEIPDINIDDLPRGMRLSLWRAVQELAGADCVGLHVGRFPGDQHRRLYPIHNSGALAIAKRFSIGLEQQWNICSSGNKCSTGLPPAPRATLIFQEGYRENRMESAKSEGDASGASGSVPPRCSGRSPSWVGGHPQPSLKLAPLRTVQFVPRWASLMWSGPKSSISNH